MVTDQYSSPKEVYRLILNLLNSFAKKTFLKRNFEFKAS